MSVLRVGLPCLASTRTSIQLGAHAGDDALDDGAFEPVWYLLRATPRARAIEP